MGKQVNFFFLPSDTENLARTLALVEPYLVLHSRSFSNEPRVLGGLGLKESGDDWPFLYLVRPDDLKHVIMQHVPAQGYWAVDVLRSPVIEFQRGILEGRELRSSRAYVVEKFFSPKGDEVQKPESFRNWAQKVLGAIRRALAKNDKVFAGQDANLWQISGKGIFVS